jgi:hypothetical protein
VFPRFISERAGERDRHQESYFDVLPDLQKRKTRDLCVRPREDFLSSHLFGRKLSISNPSNRPRVLAPALIRPVPRINVSGQSKAALCSGLTLRRHTALSVRLTAAQPPSERGVFCFISRHGTKAAERARAARSIGRNTAFKGYRKRSLLTRFEV